MSQSFDDTYFSVSRPMVVASRAARLPLEERERVDGMAWLIAKHNELKNMDPKVAEKAYQRLEPEVQESLKTYFGGEELYSDEQSALGGAWRYIRNTADSVLDTLGDYAQKITQPYRAFRIAQEGPEKFFSKKTWQMAANGERLFDPDEVAKVDSYYSREVSMIAKRISMGDTFSEILSSLKSDSEISAFLRYMEGDQEFKNAIGDYNMAKISFGRDAARLFFDVGPGEFGAERKAFSVVSGSLDLLGQIVADPLTYIAAPFKAAQAARYGTVKLAGLAAQDMGKYVNRIDEIVDSRPGTQYWNTLGGLIQRTTQGDRAERLMAMQEIRRYAPEFDNRDISVLREAKVFDAASAKQFLYDADNLDMIMTGRRGSMQRILPRHTVMKNVKLTLGDAARKVSGLDKTSIEEMQQVSDFLDEVAKTAEPKALANTYKIRGAFDKFSRAWDRALVDQSLYVSGVDELGRSLRNQSAGTIYSLARTVMSRPMARAVADAYTVTDAGGARQIVYGLYYTVADNMGILSTKQGRDEFDRLMQPMMNQKFSENIVKDAWAESIYPGAPEINPANTIGPGGAASTDNFETAIGEYQTAQQLLIPDYREMFRMGNDRRATMARAVGGTINGRVSQSMVDYWSALTLLPRLGYRSVLEESLFTALTMPTAVVMQIAKGKRTSVAIRAMEDPKKLGVIQRQVEKMLGTMTDDMRKRALSSPEEAAKVTEEILANRRFKFMNDTEIQYVKDLVEFGIHKQIPLMNDAMSNMVAPVPETFSRASTAIGYNINVDAIRRDLGIELGAYADNVYKTDPAFALNYMIQLSNRVDRNGPIGRLAVQYIEDPDRAVSELLDYFKNNPDYPKKFQSYVKGEEEDLAKRMILHVRNLFMHKDGSSINQKLVDKVRRWDPETNNWKITAVDIEYNDIEDMIDILPNEVNGYQGRRVGMARNRNGVISDLIEIGFDIADRQVATLSREPAYYAYTMHFRKRFENVQKRFEQKLIDSGVNPKQAAYTARKRYTYLANELAYNRVLGFIDNPMERSNFAFANRNTARYYRATEDFYRRVGRMVRENPESLVRLRLMSEGLDHAGFIHEDAQGDRYFFLPVDEIMYNVYAPMIKAVTGEWPMKPMPVRLSGKIKMLTPSLDPEAAIPTFSGPLAAMSLSTIAHFLPLEYREEFVRATLGPYAENRSMFDQLTPALVKRSIEIARSFDPNNTSEQFISASMKSAAFYAANGMGVGPDATLEEREEFSRNVQATARNIVLIRNLLGVFSPVAPQIMTNADVPKHLLDSGVVSFKDEFNKLVSAEITKGNPNAYDDALRKFTKLRPGALVYSVSETEMNKVAPIKKTRTAAEWIKNNSEIMKRHPQGAAFLIPNAGEFDLEAYSFMKREGFIESKPLEQYFREISVVNAENEYFDAKDQHDELMAQLPTDSGRSAERRRWEEWSRQYKENNPYLRLELENVEATQIKRDALDDLRGLLDSSIAPQTETAKKLREMISIYDQARAMMANVPGQTDDEIAYRKYIREQAYSQLQEMAAINPNATMLLDNVLKRLLGV